MSTTYTWALALSIPKHEYDWQEEWFRLITSIAQCIFQSDHLSKYGPISLDEIIINYSPSQQVNEDYQL